MSLYAEYNPMQNDINKDYSAHKYVVMVTDATEDGELIGQPRYISFDLESQAESFCSLFNESVSEDASFSALVSQVCEDLKINAQSFFFEKEELKKGNLVMYLPNPGKYETLNNDYVVAKVLNDVQLPNELRSSETPKTYAEIEYTREYVLENGCSYTKTNKERIYDCKNLLSVSDYYSKIKESQTRRVNDFIMGDNKHEKMYVLRDLTNAIEAVTVLDKEGKSHWGSHTYREYAEASMFFVAENEMLQLFEISCAKQYPSEWREIEEYRYFDMLNVLPPLSLETAKNVTIFQMSEREIANITRTFATYQGRYFESFQKTRADANVLAEEVVDICSTSINPEADEIAKLATERVQETTQG